MSISQQKLGYKDTLYKVAVDLPDVLEIDTKNMVVRVEPCVTIGRQQQSRVPLYLNEFIQVFLLIEHC